MKVNHNNSVCYEMNKIVAPVSRYQLSVGSSSSLYNFNSVNFLSSPRPTDSQIRRGGPSSTPLPIRTVKPSYSIRVPNRVSRTLPCTKPYDTTTSSDYHTPDVLRSSLKTRRDSKDYLIRTSHEIFYNSLSLHSAFTQRRF